MKFLQKKKKLGCLPANILFLPANLKFDTRRLTISKSREKSAIHFESLLILSDGSIALLGNTQDMGDSATQVKVIFTTTEQDLVLPESKRQLLVPAGSFFMQLDLVFNV